MSIFANAITDLPERVYFQYRNKPKAVGWYDITPTMAAELYDGFNEIRETYDIDISEGAQLDVIGIIVGADRGFLTTIVTEVAQCSTLTDSADVQCGDYVPTAQLAPLNLEEDSNLSDEYFRQIIKWRIEANNSEATIDAIIKAVTIALPGQQTTVIDPEDMTFSLSFTGDPLTEIDKLILDQLSVVPKPQGVEFTGYVEI